MFSSLRSRLWLSYALVILGALFITAVILVIYLVRSPLAYRQTSARLRAAEAIILENQANLSTQSRTDLQDTLQTYDNTLKIRLLVYNSNREILADSRSGRAAVFLTPGRLQFLVQGVTLRDTTGARWIYAVSRLENGNFLVLAAPSPKIALFNILRDEFVPPFLVAGVIALLVSLLVAYGLARWIGDPLQRVVIESRRIPSTDVNPIPTSGPHEVMELTQAFNELNLRLQTSQKSQRSFVANVSHELKTPITSIQGFAQALLDGTARTPAEKAQAAQVIYNESGRMHGLVLELLELARLDAATLELQSTAVDLSILLSSIVEKFSPQARTRNVTIRLETGRLPIITGDCDRLTQVFTNLVDNALKFTPAEGRITLRAVQTSSGIQVEVIDNGVGIPPDALPHIFDRFYQADPSRSGGLKHGSGLGLAIVKEIVAAHDGKISVRSKPGSGSTFTVNLALKVPKAKK
jgi:signal transduction histidine kinase